MGSGPAPLYSPLDAPSSCRSEGGGFFAGGEASDTRPPARRTSKPLLNLHWDVLPPAKIERTVWAKRRTATAAKAGGGCGGPAVRMHSVDDAEVEELEKLFSKRSVAAAAALGVGGGRRSTMDPGTAAGLASTGGGGSGSRGDASGGAGRARRGGGGGSVGGAGAGGRVKKVSLLDVNRGNNVAIGLKAFRRVGDVSELAGLVGGLDPKGA